MRKPSAVIRLILFCGGMLAAICLQAAAQDANRDILRRKLLAEIEKIASGHDGVMGAAIRDLTSGEELTVNADLTFPTGSSIKIPVLIELHRQAAEGKFDLGDQLQVENRSKVGGSGVLRNFGEKGSSLSLHDLAVLMIALSDNTATNMLIEQVGMSNVNATLDRAGLNQIRLRRLMIDLKASARGDENTATPRQAALLMEKLHRGSMGGPEVSAAVISMLKLPKSSAIPRLLPAGVQVANKPGGIEGASCDWGIVYVPGRPFAIAVMSNYNGEGAEEAISRIAKLAYDYFSRISRSTRYGARVPLELIGN